MRVRKCFYGQHLLGFATFAAALSACGQIGGSGLEPQVSNITAISSAFEPRIGEAYNQYEDSYLSQTCLSFDPNLMEYIPPQSGELMVTSNSSFDQISDALSAGGELSLNMSAFKAKGSLQFANEMKSTSYSTSYMISIKMKDGEVSLPQQFTAQQTKPALNALGLLAKSAANENDRSAKCGTQFVARKSLSASLVAVLKFEFANKGQKDNFSGKIDLEVGPVDGSAAVKAAMKNVSEGANITLKVIQLGGDASQLSQALSTQIASCNAQKRAACIAAINDLTTYAKDKFPTQFRGPDGKIDTNRFVSTAFDYRGYATIDKDYTPPALSPEMAKTLKLKRQDFGQRMLDEQSNYLRASALVSSGIKITAEQLQSVRSIQQIILDRYKVFADAAQKCYETANWTQCDAALTTASAEILRPRYAYDVSKLVIIPSDIAGWCGKIKQWETVMEDSEGGDAVAATIISDDELYTLYQLSPKLLPAGKELLFNLKATPGANQMRIKDLSCWDLKQSIRSESVTKVELIHKRLNNLDPLASLYYTTELNLNRNYVEDATALSKIRYLQKLFLNQNRVSTLAGINSTDLKELELINNGLKNGEPIGADLILTQLSGSQTLTNLTLDNNAALRSLAKLKSMPTLTTLSLLDTAVNQAELLDIQRRRATDFPSLTTIKVRMASISTPSRSCAALQSEIPILNCI